MKQRYQKLCSAPLRAVYKGRVRLGYSGIRMCSGIYSGFPAPGSRIAGMKIQVFRNENCSVPHTYSHYSNYSYSGKIPNERAQRSLCDLFRISHEGSSTDIKNRRLQYVFTLMYKVKHKLCPAYISNIFNTPSIPRCNTVTYGQHSLRYLGPTLIIMGKTA